MNRWLICFAVVCVGCVATLPPGDLSMTADIACEASRVIVQARQGMRPTPAPASDDCENCSGTGKLGDGRITVQCPACKGTGKKTTCPNGTCLVK